MDAIERLQADYDGLGLTTGKHPVAYLREELDRDPRVVRACDLSRGRADDEITIAGLVICRQRPGTAKGHVFVSLEDETGIGNAFVHGEIFDRYRLILTQEPFLKISGRLQIQHGVASVYCEHAEGIAFAATVRGSRTIFIETNKKE